MAGYFDSNGIYFYDEADPWPTTADVLNVAQHATSDAIEPLVALVPVARIAANRAVDAATRAEAAALVTSPLIVPANDAVAVFVTVAGATKTAVSTAIDSKITAFAPTIDSKITTASPVAKQIQGGNFLKPVRVPTLTVEKSWPDRNVDYRILWTEANGATLYAIGYDNTLRKSLDGGISWAKKGTQSFGTTDVGAFLKKATGTLLMMRPGTTCIIMRSVDDGVTWTTATSPANSKSAHYAMGSQSWAVDPVTGYVYYGEYSTLDTQTTISVYRSTDDGATFTEFHAFPATASASADKIRHIHSVQWDHIMQRIIVLTGDSAPAAGMYRVNSAGTDLEPLLLNRDVPSIPDGARGIGIIPFPEYLCWTGDSTGNPYLMRMARTEIGKVAPVVERIYRLNSTAWFTCRASDDGTRWVLSASQELASKLDNAVHLYAVEDQGATVYEVGALAVGPNGLAALSPIGTPGNNGDAFFLQGHNVGTRRPVWKMRLAQGTAQIAWPAEQALVYGWQTLNSGSAALAAAALTVFAQIKAPLTGLNLRIYDSGVAAQSGDTAAARFSIRIKGGATLYTSTVSSDRNSSAARLEAGGPIASVAVTAGADLELCIYSGGTSGAFVGTAFVTFGFGY